MFFLDYSSTRAVIFDNRSGLMDVCRSISSLGSGRCFLVEGIVHEQSILPAY